MRRVEQEITCGRVAPEYFGQHPLPGSELAVAVFIVLDDACVNAERGVVDEDVLIEGSEIDTPLDSIRERIERPDDVVPVEAEVECKVVARSSGNADVGNVTLHRDPHDQRLRAIAPCHSDDVCTLRGGSVGQLAKVVTGSEQQRFDAPLPRLLGQVEAFCFPATGLGIDDQHALSRRVRRARMPARHLLRGDCVSHRIAGRKAEEHEHRDQHGQRHLVVVRERGQPGEPEDDERQTEQTQEAAAGQHEPAEEGSNEDQSEHEDDTDRVVRHGVDRQGEK